MLYQLGALSIKVHPFNVDKVQREAATDYVPKPILGTEPPMEYVGEGANTWRLSGQLFPKVIGGMSELALLHAMRESGRPQFLLRGDGVPFGWVVIARVSERSQYLFERPLSSRGRGPGSPRVLCMAASRSMLQA